MPLKGIPTKALKPRQTQELNQQSPGHAQAEKVGTKALVQSQQIQTQDQFRPAESTPATTQLSTGRPTPLGQSSPTLSSRGLVGILQSNRNNSGNAEARFIASIRGSSNPAEAIETYRELRQLSGGRAHNKLPEAAVAILARDVARGPRYKSLTKNGALAFAQNILDRPRSEFRSMLPNMNQGVATYVDLKHMQNNKPRALNGQIINSLTLGVLRRRGPAKAAEEGVLSHNQALRAADTLQHTSAQNYNKIINLYNNAGGTAANRGKDKELERALLLKAVGARRERMTGGNEIFRQMPHSFPQELSEYADAIRGQNHSTLIRQSTLTDIDGDNKAEAMQQRFTTTCVPTTAEIAAAEVDPILALRLHKDGAIHSLDARGLAAQDQASTLVGTQRWRFFGGSHWAEPRVPQQAQQVFAQLSDKNARAQGLTDGEYRSVLNRKVGQLIGQRFKIAHVENNDQARMMAMNRVEAELNAGRDVPIAIQWTDPSGEYVVGGHALLLSDVRRSQYGREFLQTDPWKGDTRWIPEKDFIHRAGGAKNWRLKTIFVTE